MMKIDKQIIVVIAIVVVATIFFVSTNLFNTERSVSLNHALSFPLISIPSLRLPSLASLAVTTEAWLVFQNYLEFARTHNLAGLRNLSHQISDTCNSPSSETECFALMDNVYAIASFFELSDFNHVQIDKRQIVMFTDGPVVAILYFTRDDVGTPKVLGLKFCFENETVLGGCVETDPDKRDLDGNGWWDNVESLFY